MDNELDRELIAELPRQTQLSRRRLLRYAGAAAGTVTLLAACSSQPSNGGASTAAPASTQATGGGASSPAAASSAAASTATQTGAAPVKGGTLTVGVDQEPPTMDPEASPSAITYYVTSSTAETLLYLDDTRQLRPWLAASWEVSSDAKTFTFKLRNDVKFQDDTPFNAAAVKWNFDRVVNPNYKAGGSLGSLEGYQGTQTPDDYTAIVTFKSSFVPFITSAAGGTLAMVSPTATPKQGDQVNYKPVASGPYKISEYVPKQYVAITRWDGYNRRLPWASHDGPGYLDKVIWKFIPEAGTRVATVQSGETQMATVIPSQDLPHFENTKDFAVETKPWTGTPEFWALNVTLPPTDDLRVRQAINYAINKQAIVDTVYKGEGTPGFAPMAGVMLDDPSLHSYYPYNPDKAKQLLEEAGWTGSSGTRTKGGKPLKIVINAIDYGSGPAQEIILLQGQLRDVGIDAQLKVQARPPWYEDNYH